MQKKCIQIGLLEVDQIKANHRNTSIKINDLIIISLSCQNLIQLHFALPQLLLDGHVVYV